MKKMEEDKEIENSNPGPTTEKLSELHPSILAKPRIENAKIEAKEQREEEILANTKDPPNQKVEEDTDAPDKDGDLTMLDETEINLVGKKSNKDKHIKLVSDNAKYDIKEDINNTLANITIAQLLDISPKVRAEFLKQLRFQKDDPSVNLVHKGKIAISRCKVYNVPSKVYLDYGAGINLISKSYLNKLPVKLSPIGISTSSIVQVLSDVDQTPGLIYKLPVSIGNTTFEAEFRLVDKDDLLFDMIICYETIIENYLFINPVTLELCQVNPKYEFNRLKELF